MHPPRTRRPIAAPLALVVAVALGVTACGGGSSGGSGDDAATAQGTSVAQLCGALTDFQADLASASSGDPTTYAAQLKAAATRLTAVGLPDEIPDDARTAFDTQLDLISGLPDAATEADLTAVGQAAEDPALERYLKTACPTT